MLEVSVGCGACGSPDIYMQPCPECEHVQASVCFDCGEVYRVANHHGPACDALPAKEPAENVAQKASAPATAFGANPETADA